MGSQPEPRNLRRLKKAIRDRWGQVPLIDMVTEAALRTGMLGQLTAVGPREALARAVLWERLLVPRSLTAPQRELGSFSSALKATGLPTREPGHRAGQNGCPDRAGRPWADGWLQERFHTRDRRRKPGSSE